MTERTIAARKLVQEHYAQQADKSVFRIPYEDYVEVHHLPKGAHKDFDLTVKMRYEGDSPAFAPGQTKTLCVSVTNQQHIAGDYALVLDIPGFTDQGSCALSLGAGETASCKLKLTAPANKMPLFRGQLEIKQSINGAYWHSQFVPITLLPTMDWRVVVDGAVHTAHCHTNRLAVDGFVRPGIQTLVAETTLMVPEDCEATLKFACRNPLKATLDGATLFESQDETSVIPAYHRADRRKCADVKLSRGEHTLSLEAGNPEALRDLFFMVVKKNQYWAYDLDKTFV